MKKQVFKDYHKLILIKNKKGVANATPFGFKKSLFHFQS